MTSVTSLPAGEGGFAIRLQLAQRLVSTPDYGRESCVEELWSAEAEWRLEEFRGSRVQGVDSGDAFHTAREALNHAEGV